MLSVWEILPAQVSLPSLVEVVGLLHNWIRSPSRPTAEWRSSLQVLVCVSVQIWSPGLHFGVLIWVIFWSLFRVPFLGTVLGPVLGPYNYKQNPGPQNRAQKWNPKQGPKYDPNQAPKCNPAPQICTERKQGRVEMIFIQRSVCLAILFNCATNQQLQPKKEGKLGRAKLLKQRAWIHSQTKHTGIHALCLRNFARPSFPSFFGWSCWFVAQLNKIAKQTDRWMKIISTGPCLRLRTNLEPRIAFWGPDLGYILVPVSGSIFGHCFGSRFGPLQLQTKSRAPKPRPKMEPKTRTKIWPKSGPKMQSGPPNLYGAQTRTCRDDLHSAVGLLGDLIQLCNKPTTSTKEGRETWAGKIAQTKSMNTFADQTYLEGTPNGHHILPPFQPPKIGPLNCHICQHQHSGNLHTKSEREREREREREEGCM